MADLLREMHKHAHANPEARATLVPLIRIALRSGNRGWGFFGTVQDQGYSMGQAQKLFTMVGERLMQLDPRLTEELTVEALDSRWGRHLADWIGDEFSYQMDEDENITQDADFAGFVRALQNGRLDLKLRKHLKALSKMGGPRLAAGGVPVYFAEIRENYYALADAVSGWELWLNSPEVKKQRRNMKNDNEFRAVATVVKRISGDVSTLYRVLNDNFPKWD